jgi:hypothetical protein
VVPNNPVTMSQHIGHPSDQSNPSSSTSGLGRSVHLPHRFLARCDYFERPSEDSLPVTSQIFGGLYGVTRQNVVPGRVSLRSLGGSFDPRVFGEKAAPVTSGVSMLTVGEANSE